MTSPRDDSLLKGPAVPKLTAWLLGCVLIGLTSQALWAAEEIPTADLFVAHDGHDDQPGTHEKPLRTLARAQQLVREKLAAGAAGDLKILVRGGTYRLAEPLRFGPEDSAPIGSTITYAAYPEEEVILSGGQRLEGWEQQGDVLQTRLPEMSQQERGFRELFINGRRATRARTPNQGYFRVEQAGPDNRTSFTYREGDLQPWKELQDGEMVFLHDWSTSRIKLGAIDPQQRTISFPHPIGASAPHYRITAFEPNPRYFIENLPELLDVPGEWHLDRTSGLLRYWPQAGETADALEAVVPRLESLIEVRGTHEGEQLVRGLKFSGFKLQHCRWHPPQRGYADGQATFYEQRDDPQHATRRTLMPTAITFDLAEDCVLENCTIEQLGGSGIALRETCRNNQILRCRLRDIAGNGINIGETITRGPLPTTDNPQDVPPLVSRGNRVADCTIEHCGVLYYGAVGIWIGIAAETQIVHNELRNLPYTGISVGWRWDPSPTGCRGNLIAHNHIHHIMQILSDGGGIYTLGWQPGTILRGNRIHDVPVNAGRAESNGIFMDEGTTALLVEGNTIYQIARSPIRFHKAGVNVLRNNRLVSRPGNPTFRYNATPEHMVFEDNEALDAESYTPPADDPTADAGVR